MKLIEVFTLQKLRLLFVSITALLMLAACTQESVGLADPEPPLVEDFILEPSQELVYELPDIDDPSFPFIIPYAEGEFALNEEEQAAFDEYIYTGDIYVLYGLDPVSVIKIWIQSGIEGHFEREFGLFHPETLFEGENLSVYLDNVDMSTTQGIRQRFADLFFSDIDNGERSEIEELDDGSRLMRVTFLTETNELATLAARTNEAGIWLVERSSQ